MPSPDPVGDKIAGALWGAVVGDALGVPVEFTTRRARLGDPVTGLRGFGTHHQPPGTWSDDSALLLCSAESLVECGGFDPAHMATTFVRWWREGHWSPHGQVFDIGAATSAALSRLAHGTPPTEAGGADEFDNGNGSLMRLFPASAWAAGLPAAEAARAVCDASSITHRHPRTLLVCVLFSAWVRGVLAGGADPQAVWREAWDKCRTLPAAVPWASEWPHLAALAPDVLPGLGAAAVRGSGYSVHCLQAALWCVFQGGSYADITLRAVNLGEDTDTTGCVAGAMAGLLLGAEAVPERWVRAIARQHEVAALVSRFSSACASHLSRRSVDPP